MEKDLATVVEFVSRVRVNCRTLVTNPFNVTAGEALADLMLEVAPLAEEALARIAAAGIADGSTGATALVEGLAELRAG